MIPWQETEPIPDDAILGTLTESGYAVNPRGGLELFLFAWHDAPQGGALDFRGAMTTAAASRLVRAQGYKHAHLCLLQDGGFLEGPRLIVVGFLQAWPDADHHTRLVWSFPATSEIVELEP